MVAEPAAHKAPVFEKPWVVAQLHLNGRVSVVLTRGMVVLELGLTCQLLR